VKAIESDALVVRTIAYGEADVIATFITESSGKLSAHVRGARRSKRRLGGGLEPFHTMRVSIDDRGGDLVTLKEARVVRVRAGITASLALLDVAGTALRWLRHLVPARHPEAAAWATTLALLDALDLGPAEPRVELAGAALRLLADVGYALDLGRCVVCGKACPDDKPAAIDAARGGLVCAACGGARQVLAPGVRRRALAAQRGEKAAFTREEAEQILAVVDVAMAAHGGIEPK
jgi:DNA repair protein RecO (recombination protein O)